MEKYRNRHHLLLLYPDNEQHMEVLDKVKKSFDFCAIQHDRDIWTVDDERKNSEHKAGEKKKAHFHVVLRFKNATWNTAVCKDLGLDIKFCEEVKNVDKALQYLMHYNEPDKTQYSIEDVFGTMKTRLIESIAKDAKTEGEKVCELLEFIENYNGRLTVTEFAKYCAKNGYWSEFRRSGAIFCKILEENGVKYDIHMAEDNARFKGYVAGHSDARNKGKNIKPLED